VPDMSVSVRSCCSMRICARKGEGQHGRGRGRVAEQAHRLVLGLKICARVISFVLVSC